jgi:hypothetical protein
MWSYILGIFLVDTIDKERGPRTDEQRAHNELFKQFLWKWVFVPFAVLFIIAWMFDKAHAQTSQHTFRDSSGRTMGRSVTDTRGNTNYYDSMGRTTGRSSTDSRGNTTIYNPLGQQTGTIRSK